MTSPAPPRTSAATAAWASASWTRSSAPSATPTRTAARSSRPTFTLDHDYLSFEVAGGAQPSTQVRLVVDGSVVRTASGRETGTLNWTAWNVADLRGKQARIVIADESTGGWGHILADHFVLGDTPAKIRSDGNRGQPARRRRGRAQQRRQGERGAGLGVVGRACVEGQASADPDRRPQQRRLGAHPRRPDHVLRRAQRRAPSSARTGSTTARTTTPPSPGTTRPAVSA